MPGTNSVILWQLSNCSRVGDSEEPDKLDSLVGIGLQGNLSLLLFIEIFIAGAGIPKGVLFSKRNLQPGKFSKS